MRLSSRWTSVLALSLSLCVPAIPAVAHSPTVSDAAAASPEDAVVLEDPTRSLALGATIAEPGEVDWYRLDLEAGDPLVVGMTAPDATGALAATFVILGPGLPDASSAGEMASAFAEAAGTDGALAFQPLPEPAREVHGGLGFWDYGTLRTTAPESGSYYVVVFALDPAATGKYVLAPGVREAFGLDSVGGMLDLIAFFDAPWPPQEDAEAA